MEPSLDVWLILLGAIAATYFWRGIAVPLSTKIDSNSHVFEWITCVTYALLAGLISRMIFLPYGELASTPISERIAAVAFALVTFFLFNRNLLLGIGSGVIIFLVLQFYPLAT
tara:strand:+ start:1163 stop:1501 length:339 start_codon:yes stop_codon:yes gene_type:complete